VPGILSNHILLHCCSTAAPLLTRVVHVLLDIYEDVLGQSTMIDELFNRLKRAVEGEVLAEHCLLCLLGQVDGIITVAQMKQVHEEYV
jgi:hypothetical protein